MLLPQHTAAPADVTAHESLAPVAIADTPDDNPDTATGTGTGTGTDELVVELFPNWPLVLRPQHDTAPADVNAHEWEVPVAIADTPDDNPDTATGTNDWVVTLFPNWPVVLRPQQVAAPADVNAHECWFALPVAIADTPDDNPDTATGTDELAVELFPNWPVLLAPQHTAAPADVNAHEWAPPPAMAVTPDVNPDTATGTDDWVVELFPNWPPPLRPQHDTAPPDVNAHEWEKPVAIAVTPDDNPDTATGTEELVVEPFPNRPLPLMPQHTAAPADVNAHEWASPVAIAVTPDDNPETVTGTEELVVEPFPNCPFVLRPQHDTAPADVNAHEWEVPVAIAVTPDDNPDTVTGTEELAVELFPNWPLALKPQHFTAPAGVNAHE